MNLMSILAVERLIAEIGYDAVIDALLAEAETAPEDELGTIEAMLDAVMAGLVAQSGGRPQTGQA